MSEQSRLRAFLEETAARADVPGKLRKLVVSHVIKGNKIGDEIRAVAVPAELDDEWISKTADRIVEQAVTEATTLQSGVQTYVVQTLFEGDDKPHGRHLFSVNGGEDPSQIATHGPDADGLVGQAQGLTTFFAREFARTTVQRERSLLEENQQLRKENADLRAEAARRYKLMEELASAKHERDLEMIRETGKQKRFDRSAEALEMMVPMAINHFAGRKVLPESAPESILLKQFADGMTQDKFTQIAGILGPEQTARLWHLMTAVSKPAPDPEPAAQVAKVSESSATSNGAAHP